MSTPETQPEGGASCPRCGAPIASEQRWCLNCGAAARTRIARTPNWRMPIALGALIVALCGVALAFGFARLANTDTDLANARARSSPVTVTTTVPAATTTAPTTTTTTTTTTPATSTTTTSTTTTTSPATATSHTTSAHRPTAGTGGARVPGR